MNNELKYEHNDIHDLIPLPFPKDILFIIEQFTRPYLPRCLIDDIHNYVYYLNYNENQNNKYKTSEYFDIITQTFIPIQVKVHSSFYTSMKQYIQYCFDLYPKYPSFDVVLSRSFFSLYNLHDKFRVFKKHIQINHKHDHTLYTCYCNNKHDIFCECFEPYSKRSFRILLGLCNVHERNMLFHI